MCKKVCVLVSALCGGSSPTPYLFTHHNKILLTFLTPIVNTLQDGLDLDTYLHITVSCTIARTVKLLYSVT